MIISIDESYQKKIDFVNDYFIDEAPVKKVAKKNTKKKNKKSKK